MTKIIAFSGNSNTGKSTAIQQVQERLIAKNPNLRIKTFSESARAYLEAHDGVIEDLYEFESFIIRRELERLAEVRKLKNNNEVDLILLDRTTLDEIIYCYRNLINGDLPRVDMLEDYRPIIQDSKDLYDHIIFFSTPIKVDRRFPIYNNEHINAVFEHSARFVYADQIIVHANNISFQKNLGNTIIGNLFDL